MALLLYFRYVLAVVIFQPIPYHFKRVQKNGLKDQEVIKFALKKSMESRLENSKGNHKSIEGASSCPYFSRCPMII